MLMRLLFILFSHSFPPQLLNNRFFSHKGFTPSRPKHFGFSPKYMGCGILPQHAKRLQFFCFHLFFVFFLCVCFLFCFAKRRVLVQEWVEGEKGPWKEDGEKLLTIGLQCSVLQVLESGE